MFILSLLLIVTGALVRNVLPIHSPAVDMRQVGSILIASGTSVLVLKLAGLVLRGTGRARVPSRTERYADRAHGQRSAMPERPAAPYRSMTAPRNAYGRRGMFDSTNRSGWAKMSQESSRPAPYRGMSMSDPRNPYGWTNPYSVNNPNSVHNRHDRMQQQMQHAHRSNAQSQQQQQMQHAHRSNAQSQQQQQMSHRHRKTG